MPPINSFKCATCGIIVLGMVVTHLVEVHPGEVGVVLVNPAEPAPEDTHSHDERSPEGPARELHIVASSSSLATARARVIRILPGR